MAGSITPLPIVLEDEKLKAEAKVDLPKTIVVRYGYQKKIAELAYEGADRVGCGSKVLVRTERGTEIGEMLTTTCPNSGCASAVTRTQMLEYIEQSGGKEFPFSNKGKVLGVATIEDLNKQKRLDEGKPKAIKKALEFIKELELEMKLVEVEYLLGEERVIFYYTAEDWVDFRELVKKLAGAMQTRIEMCQVNSREEARLVADYEKCGQHCCCKQFLKVLKPVSMRAAKVQKATLDPQKISGRCGRLMCCLRYEDKTYSELKKNLPARKSLVETEDGVGIVLDTQILTQLALVKIGINPPTAYPIEQIRVLDKEEAKVWREEEKAREEAKWSEHSKAAERKRSRRFEDGDKKEGRGGRDERGGKRRPRRDDGGGRGSSEKKVSSGYSNNKNEGDESGGATRKKKRRTRRKRRPEGEVHEKKGSGSDVKSEGNAPATKQEGEKKKEGGEKKTGERKSRAGKVYGGNGGNSGITRKRRPRRRRRRRPTDGGGEGSGGNSGGE